MFETEDILEATQGEFLSGDTSVEFSGVSTDTRKIEKGALFIAVKGPNFDGHDFIVEAMNLGANGAVVSNDVSPVSGRFVVIKVDDTIRALGKIAHLHRRKFDIPIIALTGSNGKTTTKEMTARVLSLKFNVLKNEGTENNFIGVAQTLLKMQDEHTIAVIELGTNHFGEISYLTDIVGPTCGMIINIGPSHLEFFGSVENVRKEKLDLLKRMGQECSVIVNGDDGELLAAAKEMCGDVTTFGFSENCDFIAGGIQESDCSINFTINDTYPVKLKVLGKHNVYNALAAIAAGSLYGVEPDAASKALEDFVLPKMRMEHSVCGGIAFIFDCYNSNPASMRGAIETINNMGPAKRKVLVAGDMLELGEAGPEFHREVGRFAAKSGIDLFVGVGALSGYILEGAQEEGIGGKSLLRFENSSDAGKALKDILQEGDLVLVKGSRGMKMEEIKKCFTTCSTP